MKKYLLKYVEHDRLNFTDKTFYEICQTKIQLNYKLDELEVINKSPSYVYYDNIEIYKEI